MATDDYLRAREVQILVRKNIEEKVIDHDDLFGGARETARGGMSDSWHIVPGALVGVVIAWPWSRWIKRAYQHGQHLLFETVPQWAGSPYSQYGSGLPLFPALRLIVHVVAFGRFGLWSNALHLGRFTAQLSAVDAVGRIASVSFTDRGVEIDQRPSFFRNVVHFGGDQP